MTIAYIRKQLIEDEDYTCASICITREEWETLKFKCMLLDDEDNTAFSEKDTEDGYNLILLHPLTKVLFWAYSCDFDFETEKSQLDTGS